MGLREMLEENWVMRPMIVQNFQAGEIFVVLIVVVGVVVMIECRSSMASRFVSHTWGLAHSPAQLQGGQGKGHQGVPLQVKIHSLFLWFSSVISTCLAMLNV